MLVAIASFLWLLVTKKNVVQVRNCSEPINNLFFVRKFRGAFQELLTGCVTKSRFDAFFGCQHDFLLVFLLQLPSTTDKTLRRTYFNENSQKKKKTNGVNQF